MGHLKHHRQCLAKRVLTNLSIPRPGFGQVYILVLTETRTLLHHFMQKQQSSVSLTVGWKKAGV